MWRNVSKEAAQKAFLRGREIKRACWKNEKGIKLGKGGAVYTAFNTPCLSIPSLAYAND